MNVPTAKLRYEGLLPVAEVSGFGHFAPGDEKVVDYSTAVQFDCDPCKDEGWVVTFDKKAKADETALKSDNDHTRNDRSASKK